MAETTPARRVTKLKGPNARPRGPSISATLRAQRLSSSALGYAIAGGGTIALTLALLPLRGAITPLSKGFGFLVVVVAAAAVGGLWPGIVASVVGFLTFNFFFLPPYGTFAIGRGEYVVVLFVFLALSLLISGLLARWTERAEAAEDRGRELAALQSLSAQLVALVPGPAGYEALLDGVLDLFGFSAGALFVQDPGSHELIERITAGTEPGSLSPRWDPTSTARPPDRLPLSVGGRVLGLLVLRRERAREALTPAESRVLRSFCDQFALVLERDRLLRAATVAEVYRQGDQVRRSLLAAVSHDLRSPLSAIKASVTDLLGDEAERDPSVARESLESIDDEADRLNALIANLLDMSRIEGGMLRARLQGVELAEAVAGPVDRLRGQYRDATVDVRIEDDTVVHADPVFLERVIANLLENAEKAAERSTVPDIEITARTNGDRVTLRVSDHGEGVPEALREQLFYPFFRMTEREPRLGTGLGLAIAKGFLDVMGGEIWIEDTPGGGATFALSLPVGGRSVGRGPG